MAAALVDFARDHAVEPKPENVENFQNFPGEGICGQIDDNEIYIGNMKIASRAGCTRIPKLEHDIVGKSVGYVFMGSSPIGIFSLSDACRTGAKEAIEELRSNGMKTVMLTGDCHGAAVRAQEQLGGALDVVHADLLPEDKARIIKELQNEGPTAMIGDGLNDAPALATANIGISMGVSGSALATETGDIILMSNDIQRIPKASVLAKKARMKIYENVVISISTKAAILGLAIAGHPLVWLAVLADVGTCLLVILNSMLLLRGTGSRGSKHIHKHKCNSTGACSSHSHKSSCADIDKKCASSCGDSGSGCGGDKKCTSSEKPRGGHSHCHPHKGANKDHGCCGEVNHDIEAQKCASSCGDSSLGSCGDKKCSSDGKEHKGHSHCHPHKEENKDHHRCCGKVDHDSEPKRSHGHGCSESSTRRQQKSECGKSVKIHEAEKREHSAANDCREKRCIDYESDGLARVKVENREGNCCGHA